jgi:hypothetical protein
MSQFDEDQRIVIKTLAAQEAARLLKEGEEARAKAEAEAVKGQVRQSLGETMPRLLKLEKIISTWWGLAGVVIGIPLALVGANSQVQKLLDKGLDERVKTEINRHDGPVNSSLKKFNAFSGKLSEQFAQNVDSASSKLLRFGCNAAGSAPVQGFPSCLSAVDSGSASVQARDVQELYDQSIVFKADKERQRVLLRFRLNPIDGVDALKGVGLRLQSPNLLSTDRSGKQHTMALSKADLPPTHDYLHPSGLLKLYGGVADADDQEPLRMDIEITQLLRDKADLHTLRLRAEPLPDARPGVHPGAERFYLYAVVIVTHRLPKE